MVVPLQHVFCDPQIIERYVDLSQAWDADNRRKHADDLARNPIDQDMFPKNIGRGAETPAPGAVGDQSDFAAPGHIILVGKIATELGNYLEDFEKVRTHPRATHAFRRGSISARQVVGVAPVESEIGESVLRGAPIEEVRVTDGAGRERRRALAEADQSLRVRIRQGPQQDRVDHAKDGGVRADTERKGNDGESGEAR